jgi:predicted DsbA family dithiol-disulfide isomerase
VTVLEVFADVSCPFTHVGLLRLAAHRASLGRAEPIVHVRAWPLELVNGAPPGPDPVVPEVEALRAEVAPELFTAFDPGLLPHTTRPALASTAAAYRVGPVAGERFALAVRRALFEEGRDVTDEDVLAELRAAHDVPAPTAADHASVVTDHAEGVQRGVEGSPHWFAGGQGFFCPSLDIRHDDDGYVVRFDQDGFARFTAAAFA